MERVAIHAGDTCVLLRAPGTSIAGELVCVLIGSFVGKIHGCSPERMVWMSKAEHSGSGDLDIVRVVAAANVSGMPELLSKYVRDQQQPSTNDHSNVGYLDDGSPFLVYRIGLYADGFKQKKSLSDSRSVDGVYLVVLGLNESNVSASVRVITLVPDSHALDEIMEVINDDVVKGITKGFHCRDVYGNRVTVFFDFVLFLADYLAAATVSDVIGHRGDSMCTCCSYEHTLSSCWVREIQGTHEEYPIIWVTHTRSYETWDEEYTNTGHNPATHGKPIGDSREAFGRMSEKIKLRTSRTAGGGSLSELSSRTRSFTCRGCQEHTKSGFLKVTYE